MRHVRKLPGYRYARRTMVPRIRNSTTARAVVHRVFDIDADQHTPLDVGAGNLISGVGRERLPVVVVVLLGVHDHQVDDIVREIAELQVLTGGFRPVVVMDTPRLGAARTWGYPAELLTDESSWTHESQSWDEYVCETLASVFATYRSTASLIIGPDGLSRADRLLLNGLAESC
ncbi:hypothetical protein CLV30_13420 [Haloactinopolyspora alba]|uniref:Uncharacterized protein n=1 Tax=Haloactinopolyspora alba TaxID=648780 RepID=A0A2P8D3G5_9ACTN|nr:hypothetical protein [Haloactinopolyspora alba]PSK91719.1 hypothetical protein CLV30_13420 [Haloactinopolyspora alba]